jgi:hypothetical protein
MAQWPSEKSTFDSYEVFMQELNSGGDQLLLQLEPVGPRT